MSVETIGAVVGIVLFVAGAMTCSKRTNSTAGFVVGLLTAALGGWLIFNFALWKWT